MNLRITGFFIFVFIHHHQNHLESKKIDAQDPMRTLSMAKLAAFFRHMGSCENVNTENINSDLK
jgi:hypothetical protein